MKLLITGDLCPQGKNQQYFAEDHELLQTQGAFLRDQDYVLANLECPLTDTYAPIAKVGPHLQVSPQVAPGLRSLGISGVSLANNHIMDHGEQGLNSTIEALNRAGIDYFGTGKNREEASRPLILEIEGEQVYFLVFAEEEFSAAGRTTPGASPFEGPLMIRRLLALPENALKIVVIHGGVEHFPLPHPLLRDTARLLVELGASLVVCHHTHCLSAWETYQGRPIYYGLGNFIFAPLKKGKIYTSRSWLEGGLLALEIQKGQLQDARLVLTLQNNETGLFDVATSEQAKAIFERMESFNTIVKDDDLYDQAWQQYCLEQARNYESLLRGYRSNLRRLVRRIGMDPGCFLRSAQSDRETWNVVRCPAHHEILKTLGRLKLS